MTLRARVSAAIALIAVVLVLVLVVVARSTEANLIERIDDQLAEATGPVREFGERNRPAPPSGPSQRTPEHRTCTSAPGQDPTASSTAPRCRARAASRCRSAARTPAPRAPTSCWQQAVEKRSRRSAAASRRCRRSKFLNDPLGSAPDFGLELAENRLADARSAFFNSLLLKELRNE